MTNVRYWDFFLQAHASLQGKLESPFLNCGQALLEGVALTSVTLGTARPAHYTVLLDEIFRVDYGADAANALEKMTHDLCYLYGRATEAVSICPPAYYADLVCARARIHKNELFDDTESITSAEKDKYLDRKGASGSRKFHVLHMSYVPHIWVWKRPIVIANRRCWK